MFWAIIDRLLYTDFMIRFLKPKKGVNIWVAYGIILSFHIILDLIHPKVYTFPGAAELLRLTVNFALAFFLLDGNISAKLFASTMIESIFMIIKFVSLTILNGFNEFGIIDTRIHYKFFDAMRLLFTILFPVALFIASRVVLHMNRKEKYAFDSLEWASFSAVLYVSLYIECIILQFRHYTNSHSSILPKRIGIFLIVFNILVYLLMRKIRRMNAEKMALLIDKLQLEQYKTQLADTEKQYREMCQIRHDMENHLQCISVLLRDSGNSEAQAYVNDMIRNKLNFGYAGVKTGHRVVDAIANTKLSQCNAEQIRTTVNTSGFDLEMDDVDICIILGNLFDNAMEACRNAEGERFLFFEIAQRKGYVNFVIRNTVTGSVLAQNPELRTTKGDEQFHGIGLKSVKDAVNRNGGMIEFYEKNQQFTADVWLPSRNTK